MYLVMLCLFNQAQLGDEDNAESVHQAENVEHGGPPEGVLNHQ